MAKKCSNCGFLNNPDDAHFCGKCGSKFVYYSNWKLYNAYDSTVVSNSQLRQYRQYEQQVNKSWFINSWSKLKEWWNDKGSVLASILGLILGIGIVGTAVGIGIFFFSMKGCSTDSKKKLTRVEVDGKYGIGYDKDNLLIPAVYESIDRDNIGNQWKLYNPKNNLKGLAYVTETVQNIIEPQYTKLEIGPGHYSLLRKSELEKDLISYYEYVAYDGKIKNEVPFNALTCVPDLSNPGVFRERDVKSMHQLYSLDLEKIGPEFYRLVECPEDSLFVGETSSECLLYDFKGKRLNTSPIYRSEIFSDGVAWAYLTKSDYANNRLSLIDKTGKAKFQVTAKPYSNRAFYNGVGGYKNANGQWVNVDKDGNEVALSNIKH